MDCTISNLDMVGEDPAPEVAMAIKRCLESLVKDARRSQMGDLAEFLALAVLAADDAARASRKRDALRARELARTDLGATGIGTGDLALRKVVGSC